MAQFTGSRATQYEYIKYLMRHKLIPLSVYYTEKTKLHRLEITAIRQRTVAAQKAAQKETQKAQAAAARKQAGIEKRKATVAKKRDLKSKLSEFDQPASHDDLFTFYEPIRGRDVRLLIFNKETDELLVDTLMTVPESYNKFQRQVLSTLLGVGSDVEHERIANSKFVAVLPQTTNAVRLVQSFRDGISHCVFTPIFNVMEKRLNDAGAGSAKRYKQRISRLHQLKEQYINGVPEAEMDEVAKAAGLKVLLHDVLGNITATYNDSGKVGTLHLSNTRANHVELGMVVRSDPKEVGKQELMDILNDCRENKEHYEFEGDVREGVPRRINTLLGSFKIADPEQEFYTQFDKEIDVRNKQLNASKYPELNEFLKEGRIINGGSCPLGNDDETGCIDLEKAYSQFKHAPQYAGFVGKIHQYRSGSFDSAFMREHIGFYRINITSFPLQLVEYLGLYSGLTTILFSQEILYFESLGMTYTSDMGAWGERFHFEFPDYMLENRRYTIWSGRLGADRTHRVFTFPGTSQFADHCKSQGHETLYFKEDSLITVKLENKNRFTAHHILGALTAYTRINMVQAMLQFHPSQLCRVVMDGIYYKGEAPKIDLFHEKPLNAAMSAVCWYVEAGKEFTAPPMHQIVRDSFLGGQGGAGKTYSVLMDKGFIDPMIVTPCHVLGKDANDKYKVKYQTIHKMIGLECQPYRMDHRVPGVLVLDEITQYDAENVDKIRKMYPESLFVGIGDISRDGNAYQCRTGDGITWSSVWTPTNVDYIEYLEDRRSLDDELKAFKLQLRSVADKLRGPDESIYMTAWAKMNLPKHECDFKPGDVCIAATHRTNKFLLSKGIISGYYKTGGHVSAEALPGYQARGSFTIHSFQGRTLETETVYIFIDDLFEISMLYTAVSRVRHMSQLRFIHGSV
jgi:hypothetical protein